MNLLVFVSYFYPHKDGVSFYTLDLFTRCVEMGCAVTVVTTKDEVSEKTRYGSLVVHPLDSWKLLGGTYPLPKPRALIKLFKYLRYKKFDFVITNTRFFAFSFLGLGFARWKSLRLVHIEHGTDHPIFEKKVLTSFAKLFDHTLGSLIVKRAYKVIAICKAGTKFLSHLGREDVFVLSNSVDVALYRRKPSSLKRELALAENELIITFVGRLIYAKGVQDLIYAFLKVKRKVNNITLLIVGDGNFKSALKKISAKEKSILFLGEKERTEIVRILSISNVFVNPSYREGIPSSVLEAGAVGLPIIATDVGGTAEIIDDSISGFLYRPGDVDSLAHLLGRLIESGSLRASFSENIRQKIEKDYSWNRSALKFLSFLKMYV